MTAPLTPADCDVRGSDYMPLEVQRFRDSEFVTLSSPEGFRAGVLLWCASWLQVPAASLPDDDRVLAHLAGYGMAVASWRSVREEALRGFVRCDDGRLYHPVIAARAIKALEARREARWRSECARIKKHNQRHGTDYPLPSLADFLSAGPRDLSGMSPVTAADCPPGQEAMSLGTSPGCPPGNSIQGKVRQGKVTPKESVAPKAPRRRAYSEAFEAAWKAYPHHPGRSRKPDAQAEFDRLPDDERDRLLEAIAAFAAKVDSVCGGKGAPCMARWLKDGRHLPWLEAGSPASSVIFSGPPALRKSVVDAVNEDFARRWLDGCGWREEDRTLIARNAFVAEQLKAGLNGWCERSRVNVEVGR